MSKSVTLQTEGRRGGGMYGGRTEFICYESGKTAQLPFSATHGYITEGGGGRGEDSEKAESVRTKVHHPSCKFCFHQFRPL